MIHEWKPLKNRYLGRDWDSPNPRSLRYRQHRHASGLLNKN